MVVLGLLVLLAIGGIVTLAYRDQLTGPDFDNRVEGVAQTYVAIGEANVRDLPTSDGTGVIGEISANSEIEARRVRDAGGTAKWLEVLEGPYTGKFVWEGNFQTPAERAAASALAEQEAARKRAEEEARQQDEADAETLATNVRSILAMGWAQNPMPDSWGVSAPLRRALDRNEFDAFGNFLGFFNDSARAYDIRIAIEDMDEDGAETVATYAVQHSRGEPQSHRVRFVWSREEFGWELQTAYAVHGADMDDPDYKGDELIDWLART
jgi:hypothetical protein